MAASPMSQHPAPFYPRHSARSLPSSRHHSRSSSAESRPRGRPIYSQTRTPSQDSLYLSMDTSCGPIQRWDGLAREATEWNSLRRDPELYLQIGNCLVFLYAAGSSQRGPSFRIPYDLLLYSGCRPLIDRCVMSTSSSEYHPASSTPPSYDSVDWPMSSEDNCSFLYLPSPTGLSRDESYIYHLTTRNFFAWLLGVPLVGTDPVSALLDLKIRMDMWRDPGSGNFGALFDYVKEQGYGDFEALEIEMGKRLNADTNHPNGSTGFPPTNPIIFSDQSRPKDEGKTSRRNSLTRMIKRRLSRSRSRDGEWTGPAIPGPNNLDARGQSNRLNSYTRGPPPPSAEHISAAMQRLIGPASTQSVNAISHIPNRNEEKIKKRRSWTNLAGNAWKRESKTDVRLPPLQTQQPQAVGLPVVGAQSTSKSMYAQASPSEPTSPIAEKKKRRLSWKRASLTDIKSPPLRNEGPQTAISAAIIRPPSAPAPTSAHPLPSASSSASVSPDEKKKQRLSWAHVSDKIFDMMMPPASKDDLPVPVSESKEGDPSSTGEPSEMTATKAAAPVPAPEAKPIPSTSAGGSATKSSSRHPSVHDFSTGSDVCTCCGKIRFTPTQPVAGSSHSGPSQPSSSEVRDIKTVEGKRGAFETLHDHMRNRRDMFKSRSYKQIIIPDYGNGTMGQATNSEKGKIKSTDPIISPAARGPGRKERNSDARKLKKRDRSIDAVISPVEVRSANDGKPKTKLAGKTMSIDAVLAPTEVRTMELRKLNTKPTNAAVLPRKVQHETSLVAPAGPMLAAELVASPASVPEPSVTSSSSDFSSLRAYRRSSRPAAVGHEQRESANPNPRVVTAGGGRGGTSDIMNVHYEVTSTAEPALSHFYGSGSAQPVGKSHGQGKGLGGEEFRVVDADFESNIEGLLAQLEAAGISETKADKGKEKQEGVVALEPRVGMPRLVYEVA